MKYCLPVIFFFFCSSFSQERNHAAALEKKQKQIDKQITEWKSRYEEKEAELAQSQRECHASSTEVRIYISILYVKSLHEFSFEGL